VPSLPRPVADVLDVDDVSRVLGLRADARYFGSRPHDATAAPDVALLDGERSDLAIAQAFDLTHRGGEIIGMCQVTNGLSDEVVGVFAEHRCECGVDSDDRTDGIRDRDAYRRVCKGVDEVARGEVETRCRRSARDERRRVRE
jgi:hypothetical protein